MAPAGFHVSWGLLPKASTVGAATLADRSFAVSFPWAEILRPVGAFGRRQIICPRPVSKMGIADGRCLGDLLIPSALSAAQSVATPRSSPAFASAGWRLLSRPDGNQVKFL